MSALIAKAGSGVLATSDGGEELRRFYRKGQHTFTLCAFLLIDSILLQTANAQLDPASFNEFTLMCVIGDLKGVKNVRIPLFHL